MALKRDERSVLEAARAAALREYQAEKIRRRQIEVFDRARKRAENTFKRGIADRLLDVAGLTRSEVEQQVERDRASVIAFTRARAVEAQREARNVLRRQQAYAHEYFARIKRIRSLPLNPAPHRFTDVVRTASRIDIDGGTKQDTSIAPEKNLGRVLFFHDNDAPILQFSVGTYQFAQIQWQFLWIPPFDGELTVAAFLLINAWRQVWCVGGCLSGQSAGATINVQVSLTQGSSAGTLLTDASAPVQLFDTQVEKGADESTGQIDVGALDLQWVATADKPFPVEAQQPVAINVALLLRANCQAAQATLDLFEKNYQANVPGVIVTLD